MPKLIVRKEDLREVVGIGPGAAARLERQGLFPRRRQVGVDGVGWVFEELQAWVRNLPPASGRLRGEKSRRAPGAA